MVEVIVKACTYDELGACEKDIANYELDFYVSEVYNYNLNLIKKERLGNKTEVKEELAKKKLEIDLKISEYCCTIQLEMKNNMTVNSSTVAKLLAVTMDRERVVASIEELDKDINSNRAEVIMHELETKFPFNKVASLFSKFNGIYFTYQGYPLFDGKIDTEIPLK